jgi:hypothetical protein
MKKCFKKKNQNELLTNFSYLVLEQSSYQYHYHSKLKYTIEFYHVLTMDKDFENNQENLVIIRDHL